MIVHLAVSSPSGGTIIALFPGAQVAAQLTDNSGEIVTSLDAGKIDGISLTLDTGDYDLALLNTNLDVPVIAAVGLVLELQENLPEPVILNEATPASTMTTEPVSQCTLQIVNQSGEVRSGPGSIYNGLGFVMRGNVFPVVGTTSDALWLFISGGQATAWIDRQLGTLDGNCQDITSDDVTVQQGNSQQISIQPTGSLNFRTGQ